MAMVDFESLLADVNESFDEIADLPEYKTMVGAYRCKLEFSADRNDKGTTITGRFTVLEALEVPDTVAPETVGVPTDLTSVRWQVSNKEYGLPGFKADIMTPFKAHNEELVSPLQCVEYAAGGLEVTALFGRRKGKDKNEDGQDVYFQTLKELIVG